MAHQIAYEAEYECPKRHRFKAEAGPLRDDSVAMCPHCYSEWIAANVPKGRQISKAAPVKPEITPL